MLKTNVAETKWVGKGVAARTIVHDLRRKIVQGEWPPGSRLPTRPEIEKAFGASRVTVQRALDCLIKDGFVYANGRQGTFVSQEPPHLTRYALVFPAVPSDGPRWVRFWTALANEAIGLRGAQERDLALYHGVDGHVDGEDFRRLVHEVRAHRVAGLIFASSPHLVRGTPLLDEPHLSRVAIASAGASLEMPTVEPDRRSFFVRTLDHFLACGRRRIAFINPPGIVEASLFALLAERGLVARPHWCQTVHQSTPAAARNCVHLLMHAGQAERPDALLISDDNLVEHATAGLIAAGVRVPEDVEVVAHCNFPWPTPSVMPVKRLGYDARQVLGACIESIDRQRRGESVPPATKIAAWFEDEIR